MYFAKVGFNLGDIVTTILKTSNGETMLLSHDTEAQKALDEQMKN